MMPRDEGSTRFMKKRLTTDDLNAITSVTLHHYESSANSFWEGTKNHDVSQNYEAFLEALPAKNGLRILDLGCGPGRDLLYFKSLGHEPTGLDGSPTFCEMARRLSGSKVLNQNFLNLQLKPASFDGIFANASLFHVPKQELPRVLGNLKLALVPQGVLFSSNPRGNAEGWSGDRYGTYMELEEYRDLLVAAGFEPLHHYYRPAGKPNAEQPWLAVVSRGK
jgi:SAM-dependent methyltransferase